MKCEIQQSKDMADISNRGGARKPEPQTVGVERPQPTPIVVFESKDPNGMMGI